jgi:hypothetical protein
MVPGTGNCPTAWAAEGALDVTAKINAMTAHMDFLSTANSFIDPGLNDWKYAKLL